MAALACRSTIDVISVRQIMYWLAAMVVLLVVGTVVGLIWADTSDLAGTFAVVTNILGALGLVCGLVALALVKRRHRHSHTNAT